MEETKDATFLTGIGATAPEQKATDEERKPEEAPNATAINEDLRKHEEESAKMRSELEAYVGDLRSRQCVSFPTEQRYSELLDVVEGEGVGDTFWGKLLLDGEVAQQKDEQIAKGMLEVRNLDIVLARKTREFNEKRKAAAEKEAAEKAKEGAKAAQPPSDKQRKSNPEQTTGTQQQQGTTAKQATAAGSGSDDTEQLGPIEQKDVGPFGLSDEQRSKMDDIDRKLKEFNTSGAHLLMSPQALRDGETVEQDDIDRRLREVASGSTAPSDRRSSSQQQEDEVERLREICRVAAEARWAAMHPETTDCDTEQRAKIILEEVEKRLTTDGKSTALPQQGKRRFVVEEDDESDDALPTVAPTVATQPAQAQLPTIATAQTSQRPRTTSASATASSAVSQDDATTKSGTTGFPPLPPQPERTAPSSRGGNKKTSAGGSSRQTGITPPPSSAPCTTRTMSPHSRAGLQSH